MIRYLLDCIRIILARDPVRGIDGETYRRPR
jgi:hypothetical protein